MPMPRISFTCPCPSSTSGRRSALHDYGRARELLEYAALLHDAGFFVSHTDHQQHSYYLIRHSELLGFNDREIEIMANLALYHRKSVPRRKHSPDLPVWTRKPSARFESCPAPCAWRKPWTAAI